MRVSDHTLITQQCNCNFESDQISISMNYFGKLTSPLFLALNPLGFGKTRVLAMTDFVYGIGQTEYSVSPISLPRGI